MLRFTGSHAFAPHPETGRQGIPAHKFNYLFLSKTKLDFNGFKRCAVFPSHLNDAVFVFRQNFFGRIFHENQSVQKQLRPDFVIEIIPESNYQTGHREILAFCQLENSGFNATFIFAPCAIHP
jgi:hypothetical protein